MSSRSPVLPPRKEVRIDPEDGVPRTFDELRAVCKGKYTNQEVQEYWDMKMVPHIGDAIHNVAADPFLTHASRNPIAASRNASVGADAGMTQRNAGERRADSAFGKVTSPDAGVPMTNPSLEQSLVDVGADPFLTSPRNFARRGEVGNDPFSTRKEGPAGQTDPSSLGRSDFDQPSRGQQMKQAVLATNRHWTESLYRLLGPGDAGRDPKAVNAVMIAPWLLFLWIMLLWLVVEHYSHFATVALTVMFALASCSAILVWYSGRRRGPISIITMGVLGLLATLGGAVSGSMGYSNFWRQYWWTQTGFREELTDADTPALARSDFAILDFGVKPAASSAVGKAQTNSKPDISRSVGYMASELYCVAPVLSPHGNQGKALKRVNYWAVGIDCCELSGNFTCDGAVKVDAGKGVVMLDGGYPCPTCNVDKFRKAVIKAEATHGLVSADGAKFIRFVKNSEAIEVGMLLHCIAFFIVSAVAGGFISATLGWLSWYYGAGIQERSMDSDALDDTIIFDARKVRRPWSQSQAGNSMNAPWSQSQAGNSMNVPWSQSQAGNSMNDTMSINAARQRFPY